MFSRTAEGRLGGASGVPRLPYRRRPHHSDRGPPAHRGGGGRRSGARRVVERARVPRDRARAARADARRSGSRRVAQRRVDRRDARSRGGRARVRVEGLHPRPPRGRRRVQGLGGSRRRRRELPRLRRVSGGGRIRRAALLPGGGDSRPRSLEDRASRSSEDHRAGAAGATLAARGRRLGPALGGAPARACARAHRDRGARPRVRGTRSRPLARGRGWNPRAHRRRGEDGTCLGVRY